MPVKNTGRRTWTKLTDNEREYLRNAPEGQLAERCREIDAKFKSVFKALRSRRNATRTITVELLPEPLPAEERTRADELVLTCHA